MHEQHVQVQRHLTDRAVMQTGFFSHLALHVTMYAQMRIGEIHLLRHAMDVTPK